jgi:hypothetical protein
VAAPANAIIEASKTTSLRLLWPNVRRSFQLMARNLGWVREGLPATSGVTMGSSRSVPFGVAIAA